MTKNESIMILYKNNIKDISRRFIYPLNINHIRVYP